MEKSSKYFPQTLSALEELKETASSLEKESSKIINKNKDLEQKTDFLRKKISEKAAHIEKIIKKLSGAIK